MAAIATSLIPLKIYLASIPKPMEGQAFSLPLHQTCIPQQPDVPHHQRGGKEPTRFLTLLQGPIASQNPGVEKTFRGIECLRCGAIAIVNRTRQLFPYSSEKHKNFTKQADNSKIG